MFLQKLATDFVSAYRRRQFTDASAVQFSSAQQGSGVISSHKHADKSFVAYDSSRHNKDMMIRVLMMTLLFYFIGHGDSVVE